MTSTHPHDQGTTDGPDRTAEMTRSDVARDDADNRTAYRDDRPDYRDQPMARGAWASHEPADIPTRKVRETKPAFLTTEFWFAVGGIAALIVIYLVEDDPSLDLFRTALLATLIGVAYIVSRGLAKAGSRTTRQPEDPRFTVGHDLR
jgi:hypothetical protein